MPDCRHDTVFSGDPAIDHVRGILIQAAEEWLVLNPPSGSLRSIVLLTEFSEMAHRAIVGVLMASE